MVTGPHDGYMQQDHQPTIRRLTVRMATARDLPHLHAIAARVVNELLPGRCYTSAQIRALKELKIHEVEANLVDAGTYYLAQGRWRVVRHKRLERRWATRRCTR